MCCFYFGSRDVLDKLAPPNSTLEKILESGIANGKLPAGTVLEQVRHVARTWRPVAAAPSKDVKVIDQKTLPQQLPCLEWLLSDVDEASESAMNLMTLSRYADPISVLLPTAIIITRNLMHIRPKPCIASMISACFFAVKGQAMDRKV